MSEKKPDTGPAITGASDGSPGAADDRLLAPFLEAARDAAAGEPTLPAGLSARLMSDALAAMPAIPAPGLRPAPAPRPARGLALRLRGFLAALGGATRGGLGLATASVAGVFGFWLGLAEPEPASVVLDPLRLGAGQVSPRLAQWAEDPLEAFDEGVLLALMDDF